VPVTGAPVRSSSMARIAYARLLKMTVVMSSPSRACVHSAEIVYMALPSASSANTGRSGRAIAAPVASGRPWPMAPPVRLSQSCGGAPAVAPASQSPEVLASSQTIAPSGSSAPMTAAADSAVSLPSAGSSGREAGCSDGSAPGAARSASAVSAPATSSPGSASTCTWQFSGSGVLGLPG
jgi:hypothetical protein